jgi:hypothetical protein
MIEPMARQKIDAAVEGCKTDRFVGNLITIPDRLILGSFIVS